MASIQEFSGAQIASQLIAIDDLLKALGLDTSKMTLDEAFELKAKITKTIKKQLKK